MVELELLENKDEREKYIDRIEVLDKVKEVILLPYGDCMTTEQVAEYFEVGVSAIKSLVFDNNDEIVSNGYKVLEKEELSSFKKKCQIKSRARQISIFTKRTILNVCMLLRDSKVADNIKRELGVSISSNINLRKEIKFKNELDLCIVKIRKELISKISSLPTTNLYRDIEQSIINLTTYKQQFSVLNNKYRIDFYFPLLNLAIEYDEGYHKTEIQKNKDEKREYEIAREIYIGKYYKDITQEELNEWEFSSLEELYDYEYNNKDICDFYSFDLTNFIRINEKDELFGLLDVSIKLSIRTQEEIGARGMSCDYKDLLKVI